MKITDRTAIEIIENIVNDYGNGLNKDMAANVIDWLVTKCAQANGLAVAQEQASYALRYRHGEDLETMQRTMRAIMSIHFTE